jgi:hypothetical protein
VSPLQPYSSKEEAQSAGPDSSAGYAADFGIVRPAIQVECGERIDLDHVSGIGGTQAKAVGVSPGVVPPVLLPARACSLHTDSHYVDQRARESVPGTDRLSGKCISSSGTGASHLLPVVAQAAFKRSAVD